MQCLCPGPQAHDLAFIKDPRKRLMLHDWTFNNLGTVLPSKIVNDSMRDLTFCNLNHNQTMFTRGHWSHDILYKLKNDTYPMLGRLTTYLNYILFISMGE